MEPKPKHEHLVGGWEFDPTKLHYTRRCAQCGDILTRLTHTQATKSNVTVVRNHADGVARQKVA